jgi:hypothetical protein
MGDVGEPDTRATGVPAHVTMHGRHNRTGQPGRRARALQLRSLATLIVLALLLSSVLAPLVTAQEASTPVAITIPEPEQAETAPATEIAAPLPTSTELAETPAAEPTTEPTDTPVQAPNTDSVSPLTAPTVLQPGQTIELPLSYQITTARRETGIHVEIRTAANAPADGWVIEVNGTGGFSAIDVVDTQTDPGLLALTVHLTAPDDAVDGDTLTLTLSSVVHTLAGAFETGVPPETPVAVIAIEAPEPMPAETAETAPPASPATGGEPQATPAPDETQAGTAEPVDATPLPASPAPDTATPTETPAIAIDLASELTLVGRKPHDTVAIDASHAVTLEYRYTVGFARAGTTISTQVVNWNGEPTANWLVHINGATDSLYDSEHLDAGSAFDLEITITAGEDVPANSKARLLFTVSVDAPANRDEPTVSTFALASVETAADEAPETWLSQTFDGPMLRLDGGFTTSSVTAPNNGLTCSNPSNNPAYITGNDTLVPGQMIMFQCNLAIAGLSSLNLALNFSGTAEIEDPESAGWEIMASSQVAVLGASILQPSGEFSSGSIEFGSLSVLDLNALLNAQGLKFGVWVRAPLSPTTLPSSVTIAVHTTCTANILVIAKNCNGVIGGDTTADATLSAHVENVQTTSYGGGAVTNLNLLGSLVSQLNGGQLFKVYCEEPSGSQIAPNKTLTIPCHIVSLANLNLLSGTLSLSSLLTIGFSDTSTLTTPSAPWKISVVGLSPVNGSVNLNLLDPAINLSAVNSTYTFTVQITYDNGTCITSATPAPPLNALRVTSKFSLSAGGTNIPLSDAWASAPVQLTGVSTSPAGYTPLLSASGVSFGTYQFSRSTASYTRVSSGSPALTVTLSPNGGANCSAQPWYVTAQFSPLAGYRDSSLISPLGTMISAGQLAFSGSAGNPNANTTATTPAITGSAGTIIQSTNTLLANVVVSFPMALTPPPSQPVGYYLGTVTLTVVSGTPP